MEGEVDVDAPVDYAMIQIFPTENRYEAFVCRGNKQEKLSVGILEQLLPHLPGVKDLYTKGCNAKLKLERPAIPDAAAWFTKSTLNRFLHIVGSLDFLNITKVVDGEMSQLKEARKFHLSLYCQNQQDHCESTETDGCHSIDKEPTTEHEVETASADKSKNELLKAIDLRLKALEGDVTAAFKQAVGTTYHHGEIADLVEFYQHFGATDLRNSFCKILELTQKSKIADPLDDDKSSFTSSPRNDCVNKTNGDTHNSKPVCSVTPVKYGVSPAKAAQVERQSSTDSEELSDSSEEHPTSAERSRTLIRSASPRRSASPMRRVQIGRGGSRRPSALTIKSLNHFPGRERTLSYRDVAANSSDEEIYEQGKKPGNNVGRMSVQDAINLFESKQRDQTVDTLKRSSLTNASVTANRSVLRRWSAGTVGSTTHCQPQTASECSVSIVPNDVADREMPKSSAEEKVESDLISAGQDPVKGTEADMKLERLDMKASNQVEEINENQVEEINERLKASAAWSKQKEAELNQMLMKMMENQSVKSIKSQTSKNRNLPLEHRGGFYDHYKEKRDEKLRKNAGKCEEKEARLRAMQRVLDEKKAEVASTKVNDVGRRNPLRKPQKPLKNPSPPANPRKEAPKPSVTKKISSKTSSLPATRKSWPSTPSPRGSATSPAKTPGGMSSSGTTPTCRKPQSTPPLARSSDKIERTLQQRRSTQETRTNNERTLKSASKKKQTVTKTAKTTRTKVVAASGDASGGVAAKPSFYDKMTKKSSVVPLESKSFSRKGSITGSAARAVGNKTKKTSQSEELLRNSANFKEAQENEVVINTSSVSEHVEKDLAPLNPSDASMETEMPGHSQEKCDEINNFDENAVVNDNGRDMEDFASRHQEPEEEATISPTAWVEIEEQGDLPSSCDGRTLQLVSSADVAPVASPRVRHSLSQMLQEESSEPDTTEWGSAENPPSLLYQKDAPKGLKRLLKFARKSKGDGNITGWSSPSIYSEGEDDAEESKPGSKKYADNLLRKAALGAKNYGKQKTANFECYEDNEYDSELLSAKSSKFDGHNTQKLHKGHVSVATATTKASRSFFSLSAFRGSKTNETKLQ